MATANTNKKEKVFLGGYEMWLDRKESMLFDKETSRYGIYFDVMGSGKYIYISSLELTKEEKIELADHLKVN